MKHVLKCNGVEIMVSQQIPTTGNDQTFHSLKAVKVFLSTQSSCREIIRFQLKLCSFIFSENSGTFFLSLMCILNCEGRISEPAPKTRPVPCQLQNTGTQKNNIVVVLNWMGPWPVCQTEKKCWFRWGSFVDDCMLSLRVRGTEVGTEQFRLSGFNLLAIYLLDMQPLTVWLQVVLKPP